VLGSLVNVWLGIDHGVVVLLDFFGFFVLHLLFLLVLDDHELGLHVDKTVEDDGEEGTGEGHQPVNPEPF